MVNVKMLSLKQRIPEDITKKHRNKSNKKNQYCKHCGIELTEYNKYSEYKKMCNSKECKRKEFIICDEDCLNCKYSDCRL